MTHPYSDHYHHAYRQQAVDIAGLLLTITPDPGHGLFIISRIPVRVKHDQSVSPNEIEATAPSFAAQHKDKLRALERGNRRKISSCRLNVNPTQPSQLFSLTHQYILTLRPIVRTTNLLHYQPTSQPTVSSQPSH